MSHEVDKATKLFRKHLKVMACRDVPVGKMLNRLVRNWLAQHHVRNIFMIDSRPPYEVVALIKAIQSNIRRPWLEKARKTRESRRLANKQQIDKEKQKTFLF